MYLKIIFLILNCYVLISDAKRMIGWYLGYPPLNKIPWAMYTHIRTGDPLVMPNGTAICNNSKSMNLLIHEAHRHNVLVQWGLGLQDVWEWPHINKTLLTNYLQSIGNAVRACEIDGIEVDYEYQDKITPLGIVTPAASEHYSQFLVNVKKAMGPDKIISADISIWGIAAGNYILGFLPWINASLVNSGQIDFINTMSYHWNHNGDIFAWKKDYFFLTTLWGFDPSRINLGLPYYSRLDNGSEPTWAHLSHLCPNIAYTFNVCNDIIFIGKKMNYDIGVFIKDKNLGGAFPWALSYDAIDNNNTLVTYLSHGMGNN